MYRVPHNLDLSSVIGEITTQVRVGQFDIQFTFGPVIFAVQSTVFLYRNGAIVGRWEGGRWPDAEFYKTMNQKVVKCEIADTKRIILHLEDGLAICFEDDSDQYESMQIYFSGNPTPIII